MSLRQLLAPSTERMMGHQERDAFLALLDAAVTRYQDEAH
jgi:hypothetical protein